MAILDAIRKLISRRPIESDLNTKATSARAWNMAGLSPMETRSDGKPPPFSQGSAIRHHASWIYAAASINANAVASNPLRLYIRSSPGKTKLWKTRPVDSRRKAYLLGDAAMRPSFSVMRKSAEIGSDFEEVTDSHPILQLLAKSNPYINGFDLSVLRVIWQELTGNAYLHVVTNPSLGVPTELWPMPPHWTTIVPDEQAFIRAYRYGRSSERMIDLDPTEVIHFRRPNPSDLHYGMGKLQAAWGAANANRALHEMDLSFFENKARPDYALVVRGNAGQDSLDMLEQQIQQKLRGSEKTGHFLITTADLDLKPLQFPPKDLSGREEIVEEIAAVFGVPISMLKANDPNLASAESGFASWREMTILPLCRMDEEVLNQRLIPLFGLEGDAVLAYDNPVPRNRSLELSERSAAVSGGWMTANEAREQQGLKRIEDNPHADMLHAGNQPLGGQPAPEPGLGALGGLGGPTGPGLAPPAPVGPTEPVGGLAPEEAVGAPAAGEPVANTALNGAQISSLVNLATAAKAGELPLDSAKAIAEAAFPSIPVNIIESIFSPIVPSPAKPEPVKPPVETVEKAADDCVAAKIPKLLDEGYDEDQAVAIAYSMCSGKALEESILEIMGKSIEDIDTRPPEGVAANARRALAIREEKPESERGMTSVGIARARDLSNRVELSEDTIRRMVAYFERHESDKRGETWDEQGKGWQAWHGWGGDAGWRWAKAKVEEFDNARETKSEENCICEECGNDEACEGQKFCSDCLLTMKNCGTGSGGFQPGNDCGGRDGGGSGDSRGGKAPPAKMPSKTRDRLARDVFGDGDKEFREVFVTTVRDALDQAYREGLGRADKQGDKIARQGMVEHIGQHMLGFETMKERKRDALDFKENSLASIKDAIDAAYARGRDRRTRSDERAAKNPKTKNCGTGSGGFQPGNDCGGRDGGGSGDSASTRSSSIMAKAPLTAKGSAKWQRDAAEAYQTDAQFKALADGVALYTQGGYEAIQDAARVLDGGTPQDSREQDVVADAPISGATHPMASYKPMIEGQDLNKSDVKIGDAVKAIREGIRNSDPLDVEIFRGIAMPHHSGGLAAGLGKWLVGLKEGDEVKFEVPTSFTADADTADKFATYTASGQGSRREARPGIRIEIERGAKGLKVAALSPWKNQQEVLTEGKFEVVSVSGKRPEAIRVPGPPTLNQETGLYEYGPERESFWFGSRAYKEGGVQMVVVLRPKP